MDWSDTLIAIQINDFSCGGMAITPTRVQLVMAWIYKRAVSIMGLDFKTALFTMSVDLRKRMVPPLSEKCVGNIIWFSSIYVCGQGGNRIRGFAVLNMEENDMAKFEHDVALLQNASLKSYQC
ncbi:shikimate O-hydroxycinnamoyltransferase [Trifolium repens]|nr:shikimate O-hydroxycinnamoyltransferase [Trifolium repens]